MFFCGLSDWMCGSRKYPYHLHRRDRIFQGGRGGSICQIFQWGGKCSIGKYFQTVFMMRKRVTKKKTQKFTTTIYLRRIRINEHGIVSPLQCPLTWKLSSWFAVFKRIAVQTNLVFVWTAPAIHSKNKNCHPFEWLGLSVWKKMSSLWTGCAMHLKKKWSSVRMAWAICLKKIVIHSNSFSYPFEKKLLSVRKRNCRPFERLKLSVEW